MDITAAVLAASMMFGVSYADMDIDSGVYNTIKIPVHAIDWSDSTEKLSELNYAGINAMPGKTYANGLRIYSVRFPVGSSMPLGGGVETLKAVFPMGITLGVTGYASPDGVAPEMQEDLAESRMERVKQDLEDSGFPVIGRGGVVCGADTVRSDCWRADITVERDIYE